jgi:hypothetical protein
MELLGDDDKTTYAIKGSTEVDLDDMVRKSGRATDVTK